METSARASPRVSQASDRSRSLVRHGALCIVTKLMYSLEVAWLSEREQSRLDTFQQRCLRRISRITQYFYSRVSNFDVLNSLQQKPLTQVLLARQLQYLGSIRGIVKYKFDFRSTEIRTYPNSKSQGTDNRKHPSHANSACERAHVSKVHV